MQASLILIQPIAAENLCRWGGKSYGPPLTLRCASAHKIHGYAVTQQGRDKGVFPENVFAGV